MKKILLLLTFLLLVTGCSVNDLETSEYIDKNTCVVYLKEYRGGISPMYNTDGSLKVDSNCIEKMNGNK